MVFVSTNEGRVLIPALESLYVSPPERPLEVLVVDNASGDGAAAEVKARWPDARVLRRERNYGLPSNLNHGIEASTQQYVMLCNSDLVFGPKSVEALAAFLDETTRAAVAAPKLIAPDGTTRPSARRWYTFTVLAALKGPWRRRAAGWKIVRRNLYEDWDYLEPRSVDWVPCAATMFRRAALDEVGWMDEQFRLYFDDVDISLRMHKADWQVWCVPESEIVHLEQRSSVRPFSRPWLWHLQSLMKFWWKHKALSPSVRNKTA